MVPACPLKMKAAERLANRGQCVGETPHLVEVVRDAEVTKLGLTKLGAYRLHYDPLADLLGPDVGPSPSQNTAPVAERGKLRSWVGPNGQYYRELPCPNCRGRGYTPCKKCGIDRSSLDCPMCNGKGIRMCMQCGGECVIWQESIDEQPWEEVRSRYKIPIVLKEVMIDDMTSLHSDEESSPLKVKEDDEVDRLEIKIDTSKRPRRTYPSPSPEVAMKISRSLRSLNAKTGLFTKHMKIIHQDAKLHAQRVAAIKRTKGTAAARNQASEKQKAFFRDPENRLKRSIAMKVLSLKLPGGDNTHNMSGKPQ
ncbi:hypothetical protein TRIUR3_32214 [Triticum urartu]|uniref:Uncharacterized protein n=1 Tax=Triticum urartu TaxID=4572 RepID=M7ZXH4_TRIUA|nr:hypothetical protein TRIUR3_32214 [Triticum urartu]